MTTDFIIMEDLQEATDDIITLAHSEDMFSFEEILCFIFKFYGAVTNAVYHSVITAEEARHLHAWLHDMFMGGE